MYWNLEDGSLMKLINKVDNMKPGDIASIGRKAKENIHKRYTWEKIVNEYEKLLVGVEV